MSHLAVGILRCSAPALGSHTPNAWTALTTLALGLLRRLRLLLLSLQHVLPHLLLVGLLLSIWAHTAASGSKTCVLLERAGRQMRRGICCGAGSSSTGCSIQGVLARRGHLLRYAFRRNT